MNTSEKRLSKLTLFAYGMGDFASNLCWTFIGSYLSVFYTDVVGMAPAIASAIMLIAKIWDGVNDPMFGAIAERTNTKRGRFRPYILFGAPILAVLSVLAFTTIGRGNAAVIYAAITYIGCGMAYTVVNLSYGSLSTVMTTNPEDIAQLNSWRMMGTNLSSVLLNAITAPLLMKFSGGSESYTAGAYTKVAILFAICALPLFYFVYVNCKETIKPAAGATKVSVGTSIKTVLSNKPLILVFFIQLLAMTAFFGRMGVVIYVSIDGAENVLLNITGGLNLSLVATEEASNIVSQAATKDVNIIFGTSINPDLEDEVIVTVVATGIDKKEKHGKKNVIRQAAPSDVNQAKKSDPLRDWDITREINGVSKSPVRGNEFENVEKKEFNVFGSNSDFSDGDDDLSMPPFLNHRNNQ